MGCKDDDTCDQPVTKGDLEGQADILFYLGSATLLFVGIVLAKLDSMSW